MPQTPWVMQQTWGKLLFAHWTVPIELVRGLIPNPETIELDTFDGQAYVGVVPFAMSHVRPRFAPSVPWLSNFLELNVRTYVKAGGLGGVYFFSLDAANPVAVAIARALFHLPYYNAAMTQKLELAAEPGGCQQSQFKWISYESRRTHAGAEALCFKGRYRPLGPIEPAQKGSLEAFLTERYCLYTCDGQGRVFRGNIHHEPWPLQRAEAEIAVNTMGEPYGFDLSGPPLLHYAETIDTVEWPLSAL